MSDAQLEILASRAGLAVDWIDANGRPQKSPRRYYATSSRDRDTQPTPPRKSTPACCNYNKSSRSGTCRR